MGGRRDPAGVKGAGGSGCGARGRRQGQAKYMHTKYRPIGGRRGACRAWPGFETTRRAEGSRRGRRAGGPPPTGTQSSAASELPLLSADAGFWASRVVDEARHVALEEGGDGRGRARAVLGDDDVGFAGAVFLVVVVGAV